MEARLWSAPEPGMFNLIIMNLDDQLANARGQQAKSTERVGLLNRMRQDARAVKAARSRGANQNQNTAKDTAGSDSSKDGSSGEPRSLREAVLADKKKRAQEEQGAGEATKGAIAAPISKATSGLLRQSWIHLVDSWGLTLIWINIHVFLGAVFGHKFFRKLGAEWMDRNIQIAQSDYAKSQGKMIGTVEPMGLACCDVGCLLIVIAVFALISLII